MHGCAWSLSHVSVWVAAVAVAIAPCTSVTTHGQVPSSGLRLRGGMPRDIDGKGGKEMHKWVMQQATSQVGNEMLQKEIAKIYEQKIRAQMENKVLEAAHTIEQQVTSKIREMEDMSSSELERLRDKRVLQMKRDRLRQKRWQSKGRGTYERIAESDFFDLLHKHSRIIVHFSRETSPRCKILDRHLKDLAARHHETLFISLDAEKSQFLAHRLGVRVLPCLKLVKHGEVIKTLIGFDEFGGRDEFRTAELAMCLAKCRIIQPPPGSGLDDLDGDGDLTSQDDELYDDGRR